jgi:hypothetical protein
MLLQLCVSGAAGVNCACARNEGYGGKAPVTLNLDIMGMCVQL